MKFIVLVLFAALPLSAKVEHKIVVRINTSQYAGQEPIQISDIAFVTGNNDTLVQQVKATTIPWPESGSRLDLKSISQFIKQKFPMLGIDWEATGLSQVFLKRCYELTVSEIEHFAEAKIQQWLEGTNLRVKSVVFYDKTELLCVPKKTDAILVKDYKPHTLFSKQRLNFSLADSYEFTAVLHLEIEQLSPVLILDKKQNSQILANDIDWQWLAINHVELSEKRLNTDGLIVSRSLKAGTLLNDSNTRIKPMVEQGERVKFRMQSGPLLITGIARAIEEGALGSKISIILESNNESIRARIIERGVVIVEE